MRLFPEKQPADLDGFWCKTVRSVLVAAIVDRLWAPIRVHSYTDLLAAFQQVGLDRVPWPDDLQALEAEQRTSVIAAIESAIVSCIEKQNDRSYAAQE